MPEGTIPGKATFAPGKCWHFPRPWGSESVGSSREQRPRAMHKGKDARSWWVIYCELPYLNSGLNKSITGQDMLYYNNSTFINNRMDIKNSGFTI